MTDKSIQLSLFNQFGIEADISKAEPVFQAKDFDFKPKFSIYRMDGNGESRFYFTLDDTYEPTYYISVTSLIHATMPTPYGIQKWRSDLGWDESTRFTAERAQYGTWLHILCNELLMNGSIDLTGNEYLESHLTDYLRTQEEKYASKSWITDIKNDLLAFAQFIRDKNVEPLLIEQALAHPDGYAGAIDLLCLIDYDEKGFFGETYKSGAKKGEPKETTKTERGIAIVDYKSGRNGFYETHEIQLSAYRNLVKYNYDIDVVKLYNWSPKDWRTSPSYNLKDQTESEPAKLFPYLLSIAKQKKELVRPPAYRKLSGILDITQPLDSLYAEVDPDDVARAMRGYVEVEDKEPEEAEQGVLAL